MIDPTSRYYRIETATLTVTDPDGTTREVAYKRRRFIPAADGTATLAQHTVAAGERLDQITARYLGEPTRFYLLCDANGALNPDELTAELGRVLNIAATRV